MTKVLPEQASTYAEHMDVLFYVLVGLSIFFAALVFTLILIFSLKYREGSKANRVQGKGSHMGLEILWSVIPLVLALGVFLWNAKLWGFVRRPPANSLEIYVIGKQWMWHLQHPNGVRENNALHIPIDTPIKLTMISQDVIHDFFVPAFRIHMDVLPGQYTTEWFEATKAGEYPLFCSQYCGTNHSKMRGTIYVMRPEDYQAWLARGGNAPPATRKTMTEGGENLFNHFSCYSCHGSAPARAPSLVGLYGSHVKLEDGRTVVADDDYLRESIVVPDAKVVAGYQAIMPTFKSVMSESELLELIAFIKSLSAAKEMPAPKPALGKGR